MMQFRNILFLIIFQIVISADQLFGENSTPANEIEVNKKAELNLKKIQKYLKTDSFKQALECYENLQNLYIDNAEFSKTYYYCNEALKLNSKYGLNSTGRTFYSLGTVFSDWGLYDSAILYYNKAYEIAKTNNKLLLEADILNNIGYLHSLWRNYDLALASYKATLEIDQKLKDTSLIASDLNNIAYAYRLNKEYKNAIDYYNKSLAVSIPKNYIYEMGLANSGLASVYLENNNYKNAEIMARKAIRYFIESNHKDYLPGIYVKLGKIFLKKNNIDSSFYYTKKGYDLASKTDDAENRVDALLTLSDIYNAKNDFKTATFYREQSVKLKDSLFNIEKHKQLAEFQVKYNVSEIKNETKQIVRQKKLLLISLIFLFFFTSGAIYVLYMRYRRNKKLLSFISEQKKEIEHRLQHLEKIQPEVKQESGNSWNLSEETTAYVFKEIRDFLETTKIYLNDELTLVLLSQKSNIQAHHISKAVNSVTNSNFNDFINSLRIAEAKKRLPDPEFQNFTIEAIGRSVGFKSRTSFIAAFKKFENITPSDFKKRFVENS